MFADYRMPAGARMPSIEVPIAQDSAAAGNPLQVRGVGESGVCAAGAVLARAVQEARDLAGSVGRLPLPLAGVRELATNGGSR
jgi:CO/xanthine dehydrogenase Mo-binding subunit